MNLELILIDENCALLLQSVGYQSTSSNKRTARRTYKPPKDYKCLMNFLRMTNPLTVDDINEIAKGICQCLTDLHNADYAFGGFDVDYIFVKKEVK